MQRGGAEGSDFPSRNAGIGFESAERAWDAARKEMIDLGAQHYPEETKSSGFIPELGVEIHKRGEFCISGNAQWMEVTPQPNPTLIESPERELFHENA